jgi:hypothetical protein
MNGNDVKKSTLNELVELINFTEYVSTKIHGLMDKDRIFHTIQDEFSRHGKHDFYIALFREEGKKLEYIGTSIAPNKIQKMGKITGLDTKKLTVDITGSSTIKRILHDGETVQIRELDFLREIYPKSVAAVIYKVANLRNNTSIMTP